MNFKEFFYGVCYYPEAWHPSRHRSDINRIADAGFNFVRMGESAWSYWEPADGQFQFDLFDRVIDHCRQRGISVILGTPTYACPAWVASRYPEVLRWNYQRIPMRHGSRRNLNYTSHTMLRLSDRICTALAEHYRDDPQVIGWQLDNEFNCHMDVSYAPSDSIAFRNWLKRKYHTLDELNARWGTAFWSQTYSDWEQIDLPHPTATWPNPTQLIDESRFISDTVVSFAARQATILRGINARWFITHNGLFGNVDGRALAKMLDFFSHDHYPLFFPDWQTHTELLVRARSMSFPYGLLEQQSGPGGQMQYLHRTPRSGEMRLWAWESVAHGANLLSFFRWRTCPYGSEQHWHGILDPDDRDNRRLREATALGDELKKLPLNFFTAPPIRSVAILRDYDNETNDWRVNTYIGEGRLEHRTWLAEMLNRHVPVDYVWRDSDWQGYRLIIIPHHTMTDEGLVQKLRKFVEAGGVVVLGAQCGSKTIDGHLVSMPLPGLLAALAGVEVEDWTMLPAEQMRAEEKGAGDVQSGEARSGEERPDHRANARWFDGGERIKLSRFVERLKPITAEAVARWETSDTLLDGSAAICVNIVGGGRVFYIGGYCDAAAVAAITGRLLHQFGIPSIVRASSDIAGVRRRSERATYTVLLNHGKTAQTIDDCPTGTDLVTGNAVEHATLTLEPLAVAVIESAAP